MLGYWGVGFLMIFKTFFKNRAETIKKISTQNMENDFF
ncbi:MAG: hypothetical protein RL757_3403 [Bacteroidota bacterium]